MPTQPVLQVLNRELACHQIDGPLRIFGPLLIEIADYSTNVFLGCLKALKDAGDKREDVNVAPLLLFLHGLEMIDAEQVLITQSCAPASTILLRSHFETLLSLLFLFQDCTLFERRSLIWQIWAEKGHLKNFEYFDSSSTKFNEWEKAKKVDILAGGLPMSQYPRLSVEIQARLKRYLAIPKNKTLADEIDNQKKLNKRLNNWFSIDNGPENIRKLAYAVNCGATYMLLYNQMSSLSHSNDLIRFIDPITNNAKYPTIIRNNDDMLFAVYLGTNFQIEMIRLMTDWFSPEIKPDIVSWYNLEIGPKMTQLYN